MEPKRGDLVLSREKSFFSWLIRTITQSPYSHVGIYLGNDRYLSAVPFKGVSIGKFSDIRYKSVYRIKDATQEQIEGMVAFCMKKLGSPYDFKQCLFLAYRLFARKLDSYGDDPAPEAYECVELIGEACASVGIRFNTRWVDNLFPGDIIKSPLVVKIA